MPKEVMREYLLRLQERYLKSSKRKKSLILDEFCEQYDYSRNHAKRLMNTRLFGEPVRSGPKLVYGDEVVKHLVILWESMHRICSKKMVEALPVWLEFYEGGDDMTRFLLRKISASTIDRKLNKVRAEWNKGISTTRSSMLKNKIPIKLLDTEVTEPGFIEADTVAHCGTSMAGYFAHTLTMTDIYSGWTETRATWRKEAISVLEAVKKIEKALPFRIKGFASDNGNEFLNNDLASYFMDRKRNKVEFVRRRPYQKNDNAYVEQKNWTHVRELFGYDRLERGYQVEKMNEIYSRLWNPLWNFFIPVMKLETKTRVGGRIVKVHDQPKTPYQRLLESPSLSDEEKQKLKDTYSKLNPFGLKKELDEKLKWFTRLVEIERRRMRMAG